MPATAISAATINDIPDLHVLVNGAYRGDHSRKGWTTEADLLGGIRTDFDNLLTMLTHPSAVILKYESTGSLLGCVYLEQKKSELYLGMLSVAPEAQAQGIGKKLLTAAEQRATALGCTAITIVVIPLRTELVAWYQRRGYAATGEIRPFPNDPRFGLPTQPLSLMVMTKPIPQSETTTHDRLSSG